MTANGISIFSVRSLAHLLLGGSLLLVGLLVVVKPEASLGLGPVQRALYWSLHVGSGLGAMFIASHLIRRSWLDPLSLLPTVLLCGIIGTLLITPFYLLIDHLWPTGGDAEIDDWLDRLHQTGLGGSLLAEFLEVLPWTMTAWLMLNLPLLSGLWNTSSQATEADLSLDNSVQPLMPDRATDAQTPDTAQLSLVTKADKQPARSTAEANTSINNGADRPIPVAVTSATSAVQAQPSPEQPDTARFLQSLPGIFGRDIIAISSDLHYLHVFTLIGKTTVLGNLRDVAAELGNAGLQVHRSHWVAHSHVERIVNSGGQAACIMSNGIRVPVSRRRWKTVRDYYGQGVIVRTR